MGELQIHFSFDVGYSCESAAVPELRDEIAQAWGLPLGERVEVCFRGSQRAAISGVLELRSAPQWPWDPHQPLPLCIAGLVFSSREIESWTQL